MNSYSGIDELEFAQWKAQRIKELVPKYNGSGTTILDIGCGYGTTTYYLQELFYETNVVGIDVDETLIAQARAEYPSVDFRNYDGALLPFSDSSVDVIVFAFTLHHIKRTQIQILVAECQRILSSSGRIVILELNPYNIFTRIAFARDPLEQDSQLYSAQTMSNFFQSFNLRDVRYYYNIRLDWCESLLKSLPYGHMYSLVLSN